MSRVIAIPVIHDSSKWVGVIHPKALLIIWLTVLLSLCSSQVAVQERVCKNTDNLRTTEDGQLRITDDGFYRTTDENTCCLDQEDYLTWEDGSLMQWGNGAYIQTEKTKCRL